MTVEADLIDQQRAEKGYRMMLQFTLRRRFGSQINAEIENRLATASYKELCILEWATREQDTAGLENRLIFFGRLLGRELEMNQLKPGMPDSERLAVLRRLRQRYGRQVVADLEKELAELPREQLEAWLASAMFVATLDEFLARYEPAGAEQTASGPG